MSKAKKVIWPKMVAEEPFLEERYWQSDIEPVKDRGNPIVYVFASVKEGKEICAARANAIVALGEPKEKLPTFEDVRGILSSKRKRQNN